MNTEELRIVSGGGIRPLQATRCTILRCGDSAVISYNTPYVTDPEIARKLHQQGIEFVAPKEVIQELTK